VKRKRSALVDASFCGCCGNAAEGDDLIIWCVRCQGHVTDRGQPWDRTWFAQHGTDCPYVVNEATGGESDGD
jgi:hypothetical protein